MLNNELCKEMQVDSNGNVCKAIHILVPPVNLNFNEEIFDGDDTEEENSLYSDCKSGSEECAPHSARKCVSEECSYDVPRKCVSAPVTHRDALPTPIINRSKEMRSEFVSNVNHFFDKLQQPSRTKQSSNTISPLIKVDESLDLSDSMTTSDWNKAKEKSVKKVKKKNRISQIISVAYKSKAELFQKLFKDMTSDEQLILDYSCALHRDILVHGRLYLSQNWLCFYANIFGWETLVTIQWSEITAVTKEKTVKLIPNAIRISTNTEKYFFTTFVTRDNAYTGLFRIWQNALLGHPMNPTELKAICRNFRQKKHAKDSIDGDPVDDEHDETGDEVLEDDDGKSISENSDNLSARLEPSLDTSATESMSNDHDSNNLPSPTNERPPPSPVVNNNIPSIETSNASPLERKSSNDNDTSKATVELQKNVNDNQKNGNENQKNSSDNLKHVNDNTKHDNSNTKHANDNQKHANDNTKHANENQKHANDNQKHSNGHNNNKNATEKSEHKNRNKHNKPLKEFLHFGKRKKVIRPKKSYHLNIPDREGDTTTDFDDDTDDEEEENVLCPCHDSHTGKEYLSEEFNFDVDALYEHLFSQESDTMKRVFEVRNFINWRYTPMEKQSNGDCIQSLSYTLPLNYSIGPSTSDTTSEQTIYKDNKAGLCHVVLAKNTSAGVPYSDSFNVTTKYCITRVGGNRSRLKVHGEVNYLKKVFGFVKNMISKSADEALKDYFDYLVIELQMTKMK